MIKMMTANPFAAMPRAFPQFSVPQKLSSEQSGFATTMGRICSVLYTLQQLTFLVMIVYAVSNPCGIMFGLHVWTLLTIQAAANFMLSVTLQCAYGLDLDGWTKFKSALTWIIVIAVVIHLAVPGVLLLMKTISSGDEEKAYYETLMSFISIFYVLDIIGFLWMVAPYYCVYSGDSHAEYQPLYYQNAAVYRSAQP